MNLIKQNQKQLAKLASRNDEYKCHIQYENLTAKFELAIEKAKTFKSDSALYPKWGREEAEKELKKINKSTKK